MISIYLADVTQQFKYYKSLGDRAMDQLSTPDLFGNLTKLVIPLLKLFSILAGNMKSRWTDFLTSDGEKDWRNRDAEFEDVLTSRDEVWQAWEKGWQVLFDALQSINASNIETKVYIRSKKHHIIQAINRQLAHYPSHIGQIVYIAKVIKGDNLESLTIAKGASKQFNQDKKASDSTKVIFR